MSEEHKNISSGGAHAVGKHSAAARPAATSSAQPHPAGTGTGAKTGTKPSAKTGTKTGAKAGTKTSAKSGTKTGAKSGTKAGAKSGAKSGKKAGASFGDALQGKLDAAQKKLAAARDSAGEGKSGSKKRRKKKSILQSTFYRVYFAVVVLCVIGIIVGANWLRGLLADYETAQPSHVADDAAQMFVNADYNTVYSYDTNASQIDGGEQFYVDNLREIAQGKEVTWSETYSANDDEKVYNVLLSGEKFAEMTLVPSGETTKHGNRLWKLGSVTTNIAMGEQEEPEPPVEEIPEEPEEPQGIPCLVTVPSQFNVTVDGVALNPADARSTVPAVADGMLPPDVPVPTMSEYQIYSLDGAPQISVTDAGGNPQQVNASGENSWSCALPDDAQLKEQFEGPIVEIGKAIARCAAKVVSKDAVLRYCAKDSPARESINKFENDTGYINKKPEKFENIVSSDYHRYSDSCFSCHLTFDYLSKFTSQVTRTYPMTLTLYFVYDGDGGKLYSFTMY